MSDLAFKYWSLVLEIIGVVIVIAGGIMYVGRASQALTMLTKLWEAHIVEDRESFNKIFESLEELKIDVAVIKGRVFISKENR